MNKKIINRLQNLENRHKTKMYPEIIFIEYDLKKNLWRVQENYGLKTKVLFVENKNQYKVPEGFEGTIITSNFFKPKYD